jgi:hypothetical protein
VFFSAVFEVLATVPMKISLLVCDAVYICIHVSPYTTLYPRRKKKLNILPSWLDTEFHSHIKQHAESGFAILIFLFLKEGCKTKLFADYCSRKPRIVILIQLSS